MHTFFSPKQCVPDILLSWIVRILYNKVTLDCLYHIDSSLQNNINLQCTKKCHFEGDETFQNVFVSENFELKISLFLLLWSLIVCNFQIILELWIYFFPCAVSDKADCRHMSHPGIQISTWDHSECH